MDTKIRQASSSHDQSLVWFLFLIVKSEVKKQIGRRWHCLSRILLIKMLFGLVSCGPEWGTGARELIGSLKLTNYVINSCFLLASSSPTPWLSNYVINSCFLFIVIINTLNFVINTVFNFSLFVAMSIAFHIWHKKDITFDDCAKGRFMAFAICRIFSMC